MTPFRLLFVNESQNWPRASGHDVHGYHVMKAVAARGYTTGPATGAFRRPFAGPALAERPGTAVRARAAERNQLSRSLDRYFDAHWWPAGGAHGSA